MILRTFPEGADRKLLGKIIGESAELSINKAIERLNVSREKQKIILKKERETAVKKLLAGRDVMAIFCPQGSAKAKTEQRVFVF